VKREDQNLVGHQQRKRSIAVLSTEAYSYRSAAMGSTLVALRAGT
jgi:hypothetical protein